MSRDVRRSGGIIVALASALVAAASCDSFSEGEVPGTDDAGSDATTGVDAASSDATPDGDDGGGNAADAAALACEVVDSDPLGAFSGARALVADANYVYAANGNGVFRRNLDGTGVLVPVTLDSATDVLLTDDYVVWRRAGGALFSKLRSNPAADAGVVYGGATNGNAIEPRTLNQLLILRDSDVIGCSAGGGSCAGTLLDHADVSDVIVRGTSYDFVAPASDGIAVFHCAASCDQADAGTRLALGGQNVPDLVSDDVFLYWIDKPGGRVRRVLRSGGMSEDVMTQLVEPMYLGLDNQGRIVVGTSFNGVFRGPAAGRCIAPAGSGQQVAALTVGPAAAVIAADGQLRRLKP